MKQAILFILLWSEISFLFKIIPAKALKFNINLFQAKCLVFRNERGIFVKNIPLPIYISL